ncbi:MAG TPA: MlaD family protein [Longimicrobiales bacterium]|nr:MlaD family protein [Longimicrobiales bacterium]
MKRRNEVAVGLVVILGLAVIVFGTIWLQGIQLGQEPRIVQARFDEAGQILKGNAVKLRGVRVGQVQEIELEESGAGVLVTMRIDAEVRLPEDPVVLLSPESMFGDWQAQIFPRANFPRYAYAESPDPAVLPGYALPDISRLTAVADEIAVNLKGLTDRFGLAFTDETAANVRQAIENIENVSQQLTGLVSAQQKNADEVAAGLQTTSQSLGEAAETARRAFAQLEQAVGGGRLTSIVENVQRATAQSDSLAALLAETSRQVRATAITADSALKTIGAVAQSIQNGEGSLGKLVRDTALYFRMTEATREVQLLLHDLRANPRKYINLKIF